MTYNAGRGRYRQWLFDADGYWHAAEGRWDAATATLRWQGTSEDGAFVIEDRWVSADRLEWTLIRTRADGQRLQTIRGVLTRLR